MISENSKFDFSICRDCGGGETRFSDSNHWTGQRTQLICTTLNHYCVPFGENSFNRISKQVRARTHEEAIRLWKKLNESK